MISDKKLHSPEINGIYQKIANGGLAHQFAKDEFAMKNLM